MISQKEVIALHFSPLSSMTETIARGERSDPMCLARTWCFSLHSARVCCAVSCRAVMTYQYCSEDKFSKCVFCEEQLYKLYYLFLSYRTSDFINSPYCFSVEKSYGIVNFSVSFRQEMEGRLCQRHRYRVGNCTIPLCESDGESALYLSQFFHATTVHHISRPYFA